MFDIIIINFDAGSYLRMTPKKSLANSDKDQKELYLQACLDYMRSFTPMVYSADKIIVLEDQSAQKKLATLLSFNLNQE